MSGAFERPALVFSFLGGEELELAFVKGVGSLERGEGSTGNAVPHQMAERRRE